MADRVHWSGDQSADSGVVGLMGQPTGYIVVMTSQLTVKWWGNGSADMVHWSDDQSANSGVGVMTSQPTGYIGVMTSVAVATEQRVSGRGHVTIVG